MSASVVEQFFRLFLYSALPLILTLLIERFLIFKLAKNKRWQEVCRFSSILEPNNISRARALMGIVSVLIFHYISQPIGIYFWGFWIITDLTDGSLAKIFNKTSELGESLDPFSDKALYFPPLFYAAYYLEMIEPTPLLIFFAIDIFGQFSRRLSKNKAANIFGKGKTFLCVIILILVVSQETYLQVDLGGLENFLMSGLIGLALCSIIFRIIPNYWYANILSILNLACGLSGIALIILNYPLVYAFLLIFIGQFLDLFDGRAAKKWGSTPKGEIFDDIADGVSFGVAISFIVFYSIENFNIALFSALTYSICTIYRLVRFIKDKRKTKQSESGKVFNGLPSPAGALFIGSALIWLNEVCSVYTNYCQNLNIENVKAILTIFVSLLMVSRLAYIHAGQVILKNIPLFFKIFIHILIIIAVAAGLRFNNYTLLMSLIFITTSIYLLFGFKFIWFAPDKQKPN